VLFISDGLAGQRRPVAELTVPGHGTLTLSPLTDDVVLENPARFEDRGSVPLTLIFRSAGQITINVPVTGPGTP
jgi:copper(I)-binding protein